MNAVSKSKDAVICVRQWLHSYQRDVADGIEELCDIIRDGCASDSDENEYETLWQVHVILRKFATVLSDIDKGVCEK